MKRFCANCGEPTSRVNLVDQCALCESGERPPLSVTGWRNWYARGMSGMRRDSYQEAMNVAGDFIDLRFTARIVLAPVVPCAARKESE